MMVLSNRAPGFFAIIRDVLRDDAFISLSRLTDQSTTSGRRNLSIVSIVELAESSGDNRLATSARTLLNQLLERVKAIRLWRNKWLAHIDSEQAFLEKPLPNIKVPRGDIDKALSLLKDLMQLFAVHLSQEPVDYDKLVVPGDADALADLLESLEITI